MEKSFHKKSVIAGFLLPALIIFILFVIASIFWVLNYSFYDWDGLGTAQFAGISNYSRLFFQDSNFWTIVLNTLEYTLFELILQVLGGLLIAIFLSRIVHFRAGLQTLYYIPVIISTVAICQIFSKLLSVTPPGVVNSFLGAIRPEWLNLEWISNPHISLAVAAFVEGYKYCGLYMVIFYAALIGVPKELSEAATIDGASVFRQYWNINLPYIKPVIISNLILVLNGSMRSFDISYLLTKGGPGNTSELMATYMYKQAFTSMKFGYGCAVSVAIIILCLLVGVIFQRITKAGGDDEA